MKAVIILSLIAVALASTASAPSPCKSPASGVKFDNVACPALDNAVTAAVGTMYWTYTVANADKAGCLHFQVVPGNRTNTVNQWTLTATIPGFAGFGVSNIGTSPVQGAGINPVVLTVDAEWINSGKSTSQITFGVALSNIGIENDVEYAVALWQGGALWQWADVGKEGNDGVTKTIGVPCCGATVSSNIIYGAATQHVYLDAHVIGTVGKFDHANMINAALISIPDQATFDANMECHVRTCVSNQSCSIVGANYYVTVTLSSSNNVDAWYTINPTYKAGASAVGVSAVAAILVAVASLF